MTILGILDNVDSKDDEQDDCQGPVDQPFPNKSFECFFLFV